MVHIGVCHCLFRKLIKQMKFIKHNSIKKNWERKNIDLNIETHEKQLHRSKLKKRNTSMEVKFRQKREGNLSMQIAEFNTMLQENI